MDNGNKLLASEVIAEQECRIQEITGELSTVANDLLEKGKFAIGELIKLADKKVDGACLFAYSQEQISMYAHIASDYLERVQGILKSIIAREGGAS